MPAYVVYQYSFIKLYQDMDARDPKQKIRNEHNRGGEGKRMDGVRSQNELGMRTTMEHQNFPQSFLQNMYSYAASKTPNQSHEQATHHPQCLC